MKNFEKQQKENEELWCELNSLNLIEKFKEFLSKDFYSFGMLYDYTKKFYPKLLTNYTLARFKNLLKRKGLKCNKKEYLSKPSEFRLQYRYTKKELNEFSRKGQKITIEKRKNNGKCFNPPQSIDYWINLGFNKIEAEAKAREFKRENSPRCVEFYLKKGIPLDEARKKISLQSIISAKASLYKIQQPKTEKTISSFLLNEKIAFKKQFKIDLTRKLTQRKAFVVYDFFLPDFNLLIEVQGTYWHADPRIFLPTDLVHLPGDRFIEAKKIWLIDEEKKKFGLENGFDILCVWEKEINNNDYKRIIWDKLRTIDNGRGVY
jgi:very-short-patch-repair endonuclease